MPWFSNQAIAQTYSQTFTVAGTFTFTPLPGVTNVTVQVWGGGGKGGARSFSSGVCGGGGGGAYSSSVIAVTPGSNYTVTVGAGSINTSPGGDSWFGSNTTVMAKGGSSVNDNTTTGATGGQASAGYGTIKYSGGNGANGSGTYGGGGGSSAGTGANGNNGTTSNGGTAPAGGGAGGAGRNGSSGNGSAGSTPGGAGGGAYRSSSGSSSGGIGANGQVIISWSCGVNVSDFHVSATSVCQANASTVTVTSNSLATGTYTVYYNLTGANNATARSATMNFTAGNPGSGTFSTITLANTGTTTLTITSVDCTNLNSGNTASITVTAGPSNIRITFTQFQHDIDFTTTTACGIIDPGNQNDLDICISSYSGCSGSYNPVAGDTYQWEESQTASGPWNNIGLGPTSTQTQFVLDPDYVNYLMVAGDYYFRLKITRNGCTGISEVIHLHVNVSSNLTGGIIGSDQSFPCGGSVDPVAFTQITAPTGGLGGSAGTYHYQWQSSTDNINFTDISGATSITYNPPAGLTQTTYYRRYVVSGGCRSFSNAVKVTINTTPQPGTIAGPTPVCAGSTGLVYNIAAVPGATSYTWTVPSGWTITGGQGTTAITVNAGTAGQNGNITVTAYTPTCGTSAPGTLPVSVATPVSLTVQPGTIAEGCTGQIILQRNPSYVTQPATVQLFYSGTAINGTDVQTSPGGLPLPASVTIPAGQASYTIDYLAVNDGYGDAGEVLNIQLSQLCPCSTYPECSTKTVTIYESLSITATASNVACGTSNGSITVNSLHGTPGVVQYSINGGVNWQTSSLFTGLAPGTYTIWAKDPGSCIDHVTTTATVSNPTGIVANAGQDVSVCSGESVQLQGSGGTIYSWSPATGLSDPNIPNPVASPSLNTTYTLTVQVPDGNGGYCTNTDEIIVTVKSKPVAAINPVNSLICSGSPVTLTAGGGGTYSWVSPASTNPSITVNPASDASYTVIVTGADGCTSNATANVTVHPLSTAVLSGAGNICTGSTATINVSLTGTGPWSVTYTNGTTPVTIPSISSYSYNISVSPVTTTTYTLVSATDASGCAVPVSGSATVIVTPVPVIGPSPPAVCSAYGLYETFSIQSIPGVTYRWQESRDNGNTWNDLIYNVWYQYWGIRDYTLMVWTPDATKNGYRYRCVVTSSCVQTSGEAILTVYETPYVDLPLTEFLCSGSSVTLTPTLIGHDPGPYAWQWYKNMNPLPGETGSTLVVTSAGDYQVEVTNTRNGCSWRRVPVTVTEYPVMPAVSVSVTASSNPICFGTSVTFTAIPNSPYDQVQWQSQLAYQWKRNSADVGGNSSTYTYDGLANGDVITCTLTVNNLMCSPGTQATSDPITMTVNPDVSVSVSISANPAFPVCPGTQVTFTAIAVNGGATPVYQWKKNGTNVGTNSPAYTDSGLAGSDVITCVLTSSIADPCLQNNPATSNQLSVSLKSLPSSFDVLSWGSACEGGVNIYMEYSDPSVTYYLQRNGYDIVPPVSEPGDPYYGYVIFPLQLTPGVYTVRAEYNGCSRLMNNSVTIINTLPTILLGANPSVCRGATTANLTYSATTYTPDQYSIDYDDAANGAGFGDVTNAALPASPIVLSVPAGAPASTYNGTLTVRNSTSGCVSAGYPISVIVIAANTAGAPSSNPALCVNTPLTNTTIATTGATGIGTPTGLPSGVTAAWAANLITISGTPTASGTFNYSIPLTGGCGAVNAAGTITVNPLPVTSGALNLCVDKTTQWTGTGSPSPTNPWVSATPGVATVSNTGLVTGISAGTSDITYKDINGCTATKTITIFGLIPITSPPDQSGCYGGPVTFTATYTYNGQVHYQWSISHDGGATWGDISGAYGNPTTQTPIRLTLNNIGANGIDVDQTQYRVIITPNSTGCAVASDPATLTIYQAATVTPGGPNITCQSPSPLQITLSGASVGGGATTGAWSITSGGGTLSSTAQTASPGTVTFTPPANYSGNITLTLTTNDPSGPCGSASATRTITLNPAPNTSLIYHQ